MPVVRMGSPGVVPLANTTTLLQRILLLAYFVVAKTGHKANKKEQLKKSRFFALQRNYKQKQTTKPKKEAEA